MTEAPTPRIDPWSRWANFTLDSWECWLDACCKRANDGATESADLARPPLGDGAEARRGTPLRVAEG